MVTTRRRSLSCSTAGMEYSPFHIGTEALSEEKGTRSKLRSLRLQRRRLLLEAGLEDEGAPSLQERTADFRELMDIKSSAAQSGCQCVGGICDAQCECVQEGIFCCTKKFPSGRTACACMKLFSQNGFCSNVDPTRSSRAKRKAHYHRTFAFLRKESSNECEGGKMDISSDDTSDIDKQSVDDNDVVCSRSE